MGALFSENITDVSTFLSDLGVEEKFRKKFYEQGYRKIPSLYDLTQQDLEQKFELLSGQSKEVYNKIQKKKVEQKEKETEHEEKEKEQKEIETKVEKNIRILMQYEKIKISEPDEKLVKEFIKNNKKIVVEIMIIGENRTGKSCLIERYRSNKFTTKTNPTGGVTEESIKTVMFDTPIDVRISDTPGQESLWEKVNDEKFIQIYAVIGLCALDVDDSWIKLEHTFLPKFKTINRDCQLFILCNKMDFCSKQQFKEKVDEMQKSLNRIKDNGNSFKAYYVSAKQGNNVVEVFDEIVKTAIVTKIKSFENNN